MKSLLKITKKNHDFTIVMTTTVNGPSVVIYSDCFVKHADVADCGTEVSPESPSDKVFAQIDYDKNQIRFTSGYGLIDGQRFGGFNIEPEILASFKLEQEKHINDYQSKQQQTQDAVVIESIDFKPSKEVMLFLNKHYKGDNDLLLGLVKDDQSAYTLCKRRLVNLQKNHGWKVGDVVSDETVEYVGLRIDQYQDGSRFFYTACICRRFKNRLNSLYTYDSEINGATLLK